MCRIVVKYNSRKVTSFQCPTDKVEEGLKYLSIKYPTCTFSIVGMMN